MPDLLRIRQEHCPNAKKSKDLQLSIPVIFNHYMRTLKEPSEFSRRGRNLDFSVLKAQEYTHKCESKIKISKKYTQLENDTMLYFSNNEGIHMYKVIDINNETLICKKTSLLSLLLS